MYHKIGRKRETVGNWFVVLEKIYSIYLSLLLFFLIFFSFKSLKQFGAWEREVPPLIAFTARKTAVKWLRHLAVWLNAYNNRRGCTKLAQFKRFGMQYLSFFKEMGIRRGEQSHEHCLILNGLWKIVCFLREILSKVQLINNGGALCFPWACIRVVRAASLIFTGKYWTCEPIRYFIFFDEALLSS